MGTQVVILWFKKFVFHFREEENNEKAGQPGRCCYIWASTRQNLSSEYDSNQSPQLQRLARKLKFRYMILSKKGIINTHYHNSNLIWRTVSRRVDEVIP